MVPVYEETNSLFDIKGGKGNKLAVQISGGKSDFIINIAKSHSINRLVPQA